MARIKNACKEKIALGQNEKKIINYMHDSGLSIMDSIKLYRELYNVTLGKAKQQVANHDAWKKMAKEVNKVHKKVISEIKKSKK